MHRSVEKKSQTTTKFVVGMSHIWNDMKRLRQKLSNSRDQLDSCVCLPGSQTKLEVDKLYGMFEKKKKKKKGSL